MVRDDIELLYYDRMRDLSKRETTLSYIMNGSSVMMLNYCSKRSLSTTLNYISY